MVGGNDDGQACGSRDDDGNPHSGITTSGLPFLSLMDALPSAQVKPNVLKLGMVLQFLLIQPSRLYSLTNLLLRIFMKFRQEVVVLMFHGTLHPYRQLTQT